MAFSNGNGIVKSLKIGLSSAAKFLNKPFGMNRKYEKLRKTFRDYNNTSLLESKDEGIVQTTTV